MDEMPTTRPYDEKRILCEQVAGVKAFLLLGSLLLLLIVALHVALHRVCNSHSE
jgi:hypothetical protein